MRKPCLSVLVGLLFWAVIAPARAVDPCPSTRARTAAVDPASRIAAVACAEQWLWFRAFIDRQGHMANGAVTEAENRNLDDDRTPAWRRVAGYWRESGLLPQMRGQSGASECAVAERGSIGAPACRAFVVDHAWSAVFVSWVLMKARVPGFRASASHVDYVRQAFREGADNAYEFRDIAGARPATGDMLCYVRGADVYGHAGLREAVANSREGLNMHCEIVVAASFGNDNTAYLVGGNVLQGVTMRLLPLNREGELWNLPLRGSIEPTCTPDNEAACNFNRQDWAVWLKLKPAAKLVGLAPPVPLSLPTTAVVAKQCCVYCVVGSSIPRCPAKDTPSP
ncbi:DUF2272 domain-containing protein [Pseudoxanthomonas indica]|uniref:DUF2272 domain-containing protein n=1 Tax=Pseudoxanthomonas indica TaxID=428993 RepID=A0A1T5L9U9_9GAMM|nr:DUF2272 domain-containing protein [Pseudoxanthomonas indica]SKC72439.1 hypothetical protein SAMN06296058_2137 [Pseudoxanthomonas indica]